jgi:hypothetical protein
MSHDLPLALACGSNELPMALASVTMAIFKLRIAIS